MNIAEIVKRKLDNARVRQEFVADQLRKLPENYKLLDAGCGSQQYKEFCGHLDYKAQDFGQFSTDFSPGFTSKMGGTAGYRYGKLDYVGDIWAIAEADEAFDAILCTEVFEHIPFPIETLREFSRLLRPGGKLILTVPSNCLRHMDPYYFYSGFSNHFIKKFLDDNNMELDSITEVGDYYSWVAVEIVRTIKNHSFLSALVLSPAFLWYALRAPTEASVSTLCMGYHVVASKRHP